MPVAWALAAQNCQSNLRLLSCDYDANALRRSIVVSRMLSRAAMRSSNASRLGRSAVRVSHSGVQKALAIYDARVKRAPKKPELYEDRGDFHRRNGQFVQAIARCSIEAVAAPRDFNSSAKMYLSQDEQL
jgi:hypothetical protein